MAEVEGMDAAAFAKAALETLDEAQKIVEFWVHRTLHSIPPGLGVSPPESLARLRKEVFDADLAVREARWRLKRARPRERGDELEISEDVPAEQIDVLELRLTEAEASLAKLKAEIEPKEKKQRAAEERAAKLWLGEHAETFSRCEAALAQGFKQYEVGLAGLGTDPKGVRFGEWEGASACQVLRDVSASIAKVIKRPQLIVDDRGLDWNALGRAVKREVGRLVRLVTVAPGRRGATHRMPIDVVRDPDCVAIRAVLAEGPKRRKALFADRRIKCGPTTVKNRLALMKAANLVTQTANRGPWCLAERGQEQRKKDLESVARQRR